jgi:hypothetical protein
MVDGSRLTDHGGQTMRAEINLISADGTHIHAPATMSEVHENTVVAFEGVHDAVEDGGGQAQIQGDTTIVGSMRQLWNDVLDDLAGSKSKS